MIPSEEKLGLHTQMPTGAPPTYILLAWHNPKKGYQCWHEMKARFLLLFSEQHHFGISLLLGNSCCWDQGSLPGYQRGNHPADGEIQGAGRWKEESTHHPGRFPPLPPPLSLEGMCGLKKVLWMRFVMKGNYDQISNNNQCIWNMTHI